ncbi:MAG: DUF6625 family protein [Patescibacteria group bacterium]
MATLRKIFLMPYFGSLPEWYDKFELPKGYDILLDQDLEGFKKRVKDKLGIDYPGLEGSGKPWDYRATLGLLYEDEIKGYDFYGHTDFDCVYGDVDKWVSDEFLAELDVHSNHNTYVMGAWTLYRNVPEVRELFKKVENWQEYLIHPEPNGWVEKEFSRALESSGLRYKYTFNQGNPYTTEPNLKKENGKLYQDGVEICMFHFRRSKRWPL